MDGANEDAGTVAQALRDARALGVDRLDAQLLLAELLGRERAWLIAHDDAPLTTRQQQGFVARARRRAAGEPLAYLVGRKEFHGLMLKVDPRVLVPRPDTEVLVDWALERLAAHAPSPPETPPAVLDLGTGSGAIALALRHAHPAARVTATDASADALAVAEANATALGLSVEFLHGSWWQPLAGRRFDLVVSNPPYVAAADPHLDALRHEPAAALTPGASGLEALEELVAGAPAHLVPGGWLLLEHGHDQADAMQAMLQRNGFRTVQTRRDLGGQTRCTGGQL
jgi:release factor glutamine methyltransferase